MYKSKDYSLDSMGHNLLIELAAKKRLVKTSEIEEFENRDLREKEK